MLTAVADRAATFWPGWCLMLTGSPSLPVIGSLPGRQAPVKLRESARYGLSTTFVTVSSSACIRL